MTYKLETNDRGWAILRDRRKVMRGGMADYRYALQALIAAFAAAPSRPSARRSLLSGSAFLGK